MPSQIGLQNPSSVLDILNAKKGNSIFIISNDNFNNVTETPTGYGLLKIIISTNPVRPSVEFISEAGNGTTTKYIGILQRQGNNFINVTWKTVTME